MAKGTTAPSSTTGGAKGVLLMPSFAIGRTQEIVYQLDRLLTVGRTPPPAALP